MEEDEGIRKRNELILDNLRVIDHVARSLQAKGVPHYLVVLAKEDAILGLAKAAEEYREGLGVTFAQYATWWIKHSMSQAIRETGFAVRITRDGEILWEKYRRVKKKLAEDGRPSDFDAIVIEMRIKKKTIARLRTIVQCKQMAADVDDYMVAADVDESSPEIGNLIGVIYTLPHDEQDLITWTYGIGVPRKTDAEYAEMIEVRPITVTKRRTNILEKLRRKLL